MADHADIAGETVAVCTAEAEARARGKSAPEWQPGWADFDSAHCVDCGDLIPHLRLLDQRIRCVGCQERLEKEKFMRPYNVTVQ